MSKKEKLKEKLEELGIKDSKAIVVQDDLTKAKGGCLLYCMTGCLTNY